MTSNCQQPNNQMFPNPPNRRSPADIAQAVADRVRAGLKILAWMVVASAGLAAAWVCMQGLIWALRLAQHALGLR
jgi:hypothetical protein